MRTTLITVIFFVCWTSVAGQTTADTTVGYVPVIYGDRLKDFVDSLKGRILADTSKFNQVDLVFKASGRQNSKPYSKLFVVNHNYVYKLDIVKGKEVLEFANEILDCKKIKSITIIDSTIVSAEFYGAKGMRGVILITMWDNAIFNPQVAGLTLNNKKWGDNFTQRKKGDILIPD